MPGSGSGSVKRILVKKIRRERARFQAEGTVCVSAWKGGRAWRGGDSEKFRASLSLWD